MKSWIKITVISLLIVIVGAYIFLLRPRLPILNGYAAKKVCSCHFIAERSIESIENQDLSFFPVSLARNDIDQENQSVTSSFFGLKPRKALYREDFGCTLLAQDQDELAYNAPYIPEGAISDSLFWPQGEMIKDSLFPEIDYYCLDQAIDKAFGTGGEPYSTGTRAVVVVYHNQIVAELYAPGFDENTEILGWSMCKSITSALVGILIQQGKLTLGQTGLYEEWKSDQRRNISLEDLLQMSSGLDWNESYGSLSDVTKMLYLAADIPDMAKDPELAYPPGEKWYYSSGTTNLISGFMRRQFDTHDAYLRFPHDALFSKINMNSAIMELDASGNFIGSSYCFATPRDWAKFGMLYLNNGNWFGEQILSEDWIKYSRQTVPDSKGIYGAHFWHNEDKVAYPDAPGDLFSANGFQGQRCFIIPSKNLVIVRMGLTDSSQFDFNSFLKYILECIDI